MTDYLTASRTMAGSCLCFRARRLSRTLTRLYDEALRPLGVQASQLMVLSAIAVAGDGRVAIGALADALAMDRSTLSRNLRPLQAAGLVRMARSPHDRRTRALLLTQAGRRLIEEAQPVWRRVHQQVTATLGSDAATELRARIDHALNRAAFDHADVPIEAA